MTDSTDAPDPTTGDRPDLSAEAAAVQAMNPDSLMQRMGIEMVEASPQRLVATMPVAGNTQPYGLLHGGASVVLAETLGSFGAALHAGPGKAVVGLDINATHHRAARSGIVTGIATRSPWAARWPATRWSSPTRTAGASAPAGSPASCGMPRRAPRPRAAGLRPPGARMP